MSSINSAAVKIWGIFLLRAFNMICFRQSSITQLIRSFTVIVTFNSRKSNISNHLRSAIDLGQPATGASKGPIFSGFRVTIWEMISKMLYCLKEQ